jgi:hypothetical protein
MSRITIRQFHAALANAADQSRPLRAYREITRRTAADACIAGDWAVWPPAAAVATWRPWPEVAGARA